MKSPVYTLLILLLVFSGCTKKEETRTSGIDTIESTIHSGGSTFYANGFSFETAKQISNLAVPGPDITLIVTRDVPVRLTLQTGNFVASFHKVGDYPDENAAKSAFDNLTSAQASQWQELVDPVLENQVWIYRSDDEKYTKFRIISTINETRENVPYGEITFQWVHQPDGSLSFP